MILTVLRARFGELPQQIEQDLGRVQSLESLEMLSIVAANAADIDTFAQALAQVIQQPST